MKKLIFILIITVIAACNTNKKDSQATWGNSVIMILNELPSDHDYAKNTYISGDFEGWSGGKSGFKLERKEKAYSITLPKQR